MVLDICGGGGSEFYDKKAYHQNKLFKSYFVLPIKQLTNWLIGA